MRKMMNLFAVALSACLSACGVDARPSSQLHPGAKISTDDRQAPELGVGVNFSENRTYEHCLDEVSTNQQRLGLDRRDYREAMVLNRNGLDKNLDLTASMRAKALWGGASGEAGNFEHVKFSGDSVYHLVKAHHDIAHEVIDRDQPKFGLTDAAKKTLRDQGIDAFYQMCGTHFYQGRTLGARYDLLLEFSTGAMRSSNALLATLSSTSGLLGSEDGATFDRVVQEASVAKSLRAYSQIHSGGKRPPDVASESGPGLHAEELIGALAVLRAESEAGGGVVVHTSLQAYEMFDEVKEALSAAQKRPLEDLERERALEFYYDRHLANETKIDKMNREIEATQGQYPRLDLSSEDTAAYEETIATLHAQNATIARSGKACLEATTATVDTCATRDLPVVEVPVARPVKKNMGLRGWSLYPAGRINAATELSGEALEEDARFPLYRFLSAGYLVLDSIESAYVDLDEVEAPILGSPDRRFTVGTNKVVRGEDGVDTIDLCQGAFASRCSFDWLENDSKQTSDVAWSLPVLRINLYGRYGFLWHRFDFQAKPPRLPRSGR